MKFKRLICLLLPVMLFAAAAGCGTPDADDQGGTDKPDDTQQQPEQIAGYDVLTEQEVLRFDESAVRLFGRTYKTGNQLVFDNAGTGVEFTFYGTKFEAKIITSAELLYGRVFVDGEEEGSLLEFKRGIRKFYTLAEDLDEGVHTVKIIKATSSQNGLYVITELKTDGNYLRPKAQTPLKIEFVGDSITVGAGVFAPSSKEPTIGNSDATKGYAYLTAQALKADCSLVATEGICTKVKWVLPVSMYEMYTNKSSVTTDAYLFPETKQDVVIVALGTNDSYYMGTDFAYTSDAFSNDYQELLTLIRSKNQEAKIVCIYGMMGTSAPVETGIRKAIAQLNDEGISYFAMPAGTDGAGSHPSAENAKVQSAALTAYLKDLTGI